MLAVCRVALRLGRMLEAGIQANEVGGVDFPNYRLVICNNTSTEYLALSTRLATTASSMLVHRRGAFLAQQGPRLAAASHHTVLSSIESSFSHHA